MCLRNAAWLSMLAVIVLMATGTGHATSATWIGNYNVQYNYGTGSLRLQEGEHLGTDALVGQLFLRAESGEKVSCSLLGPKPQSVRSDRVLLRGECKKGDQDRWYYLYLAKAPGAFHGYFTVHGTPPITGGLVNVPETDFEKLSFVTAIWGAGGPQPTESGSGPPACPYYYAYDSVAGGFVLQGEILRDLFGSQMDAMQSESIPGRLVSNGKLVISIREEKDEVTYLDYVALQVGDRVIPAAGFGSANALIAARDGSYLTMHRGEELTLEFDLGSVQDGAPIQLLAAGYYTRSVP